MRSQRTRRQRAGGKVSNTNKTRIRARIHSDQIVHCLSQLKRFTVCFEKGDMGRLLQFGYNLGRLQELCGETTHPEIWWKPIETSIQEKAWKDLHEYIDEIRDILELSYDSKVLEKGCQ